MKKNLVIICLVLFVGAAGISYVIKKNLASSPSVPPIQPPTPPIHAILLLKNKMEPTELIIKVGETIEFVNKDQRVHNIAEGRGNDYGESHEHSGSGFESKIFGAGENYRLQIKKHGVYYFHDDLHPDLFITVIAYEPSEK